MKKPRANSTAKMIDVLILGNNPHTDTLHDACIKNGQKVHMVDNEMAAETRCVKPHVFSMAGKRVYAKKVVVSFKPKGYSSLPAGLNGAEIYNDIASLMSDKSAKGQVLIDASEDEQFSWALQLSQRGFKADILSSYNHPLASFDSTVSEFLKHELKQANVRFHENTTILSAKKSKSKTFVVVEQNGEPKRFIVDALVLAPKPASSFNLGLSNSGIDAFKKNSGISGGVKQQGYITFINPDCYLNVNDVSKIAKSLGAGKVVLKMPSTVPVHKFEYSKMQCLTVGPSEEELANSHTFYSKAVVIVKDPETKKHSGFIKILARYTGQIIGLSCVHEQAFQFAPIWVEAVKRRKKTKNILSFLTTGHPVAKAYLQALDDL